MDSDSKFVTVLEENVGLEETLNLFTLKKNFTMTKEHKEAIQTETSNSFQNCKIIHVFKPTAKPQQSILDLRQFMRKVHIRSKRGACEVSRF